MHSSTDHYTEYAQEREIRKSDVSEKNISQVLKARPGTKRHAVNHLNTYIRNKRQR